MTELTVIGASCDAFGHPTNCTEPASGTVESDSSHGITVTAGGTTREIATLNSASMNFPTHSHDYSDTDGCHQNSSHSIDPDTGESTITINGSPVYLVEDSVTTDPTTGGDVDITSNPFTTNNTKTP